MSHVVVASPFLEPTSPARCLAVTLLPPACARSRAPHRTLVHTANLRPSSFSPSPALVSETTRRLLYTHLLGPSSTLASLKQSLLSAMAPLVNPVLARLNAYLASSPDIVLFVVVVVALVLVVQAVWWVYRMVRYVTGLVFRLVFWAAVVAGLAVAYQRGPEQTLREAVVVVGKLVGYSASFVEMVGDVWTSEHRRYSEQGYNYGAKGQ